MNKKEFEDLCNIFNIKTCENDKENEQKVKQYRINDIGELVLINKQTKKQQLVNIFNEALNDDYSNYVAILKKDRSINKKVLAIISPEDLDDQLKYFSEVFNDDLELKIYNDISIVAACDVSEYENIQQIYDYMIYFE